MISPGTRQAVAKIIARHVEALLRPSPNIPPLPSPCEPGFMSRRQAA